MDRDRPSRGRTKVEKEGEEILTIVEVALNVRRWLENRAEGLNQVVDLARVGASDRVGNSDAVDSELINGLVQVQKINKIGSERIL